MIPSAEDLAKDVARFCPDCVPELLERFLSIHSEPSEALIRQAEKRTRKHYGHYNIVHSTPQWALSLAVLEPRRSMSRHIHLVRRELAYVRRGALSMTLGDTVQRLNPGQSIASERGLPHQVANEEDDVLEIIELVMPPMWDDKIVLAAGR